MKIKNLVLNLLLLICVKISAQENQLNLQQVYYLIDNQLFNDAASYLEAHVQDSSNTEVVNNLGKAYYFMGDFERSSKLFYKTIEKNPINYTANRYLANIFETNRDYEAALPFLRSLRDSLPQNPLILREIGSVFYLLQMIDSAEVNLEKALLYGRDIPNVIASYAEVLTEQNKLDSADALLLRYYNTDSLNMKINTAIINSADKRDRYDTIIRVGNNYLGKSGSLSNSNALILKAHIYSGQVKKAISLGNQLINQRMLSEKIFYFLGAAYGEDKKFDSSQYFIGQALQYAISPNAPSYYMQLAKYAEFSDNIALSETYRDSSYYLSKDPTAIFWNGMMYTRGTASNLTKANYFFNKFQESIPIEDKDKFSDFLSYIKEWKRTRPVKISEE